MQITLAAGYAAAKGHEHKRRELTLTLEAALDPMMTTGVSYPIIWDTFTPIMDV